MPRLPKDYSKTIIYKICCNDVSIKEEYIGHTTNAVKRRYQHKSNCNNQTNKDHNMFVYQFIRENGGWDCWSIVMIEEYPCENRFQAETRERYWIETLQSKLNKHIPTRSKKEYQQIYKETIAEKQKEYREIYKEELSEKKKEYYKTYKTEIDEKRKEYYDTHKEEFAKKYTCECGVSLSISGKTFHNKTKKHLAFLELCKQTSNIKIKGAINNPV